MVFQNRTFNIVPVGMSGVPGFKSVLGRGLAGRDWAMRSLRPPHRRLSGIGPGVPRAVAAQTGHAWRRHFRPWAFRGLSGKAARRLSRLIADLLRGSIGIYIATLRLSPRSGACRHRRRRPSLPFGWHNGLDRDVNGFGMRGRIMGTCEQTKVCCESCQSRHTRAEHVGPTQSCEPFVGERQMLDHHRERPERLVGRPGTIKLGQTTSSSPSTVRSQRSRYGDTPARRACAAAATTGHLDGVARGVPSTT